MVRHAMPDVENKSTANLQTGCAGEEAAPRARASRKRSLKVHPVAAYRFDGARCDWSIRSRDASRKDT